MFAPRSLLPIVTTKELLNLTDTSIEWQSWLKRKSSKVSKRGKRRTGHLITMTIVVTSLFPHIGRKTLDGRGINSTRHRSADFASIDLTLSDEFRYYKPGLQVVPVREDTDFKTITEKVFRVVFLMG